MTPRHFTYLSRSGRSIKVTLDWPALAAAWHFRATVNKQWLRRSTHCRDLRGARRAAERAIDAACHVCSPTSLKASVDEYIKTKWPSPINSDHKSASDGRQRLAAFLRHAGEHTPLPGEAREMVALVQRYLDARHAAGMSGQTVKNDQAVLSA
jgi:hypothetical protein